MFGTAAARVTGNGNHLNLPAHGVMVVRKAPAKTEFTTERKGLKDRTQEGIFPKTVVAGMVVMLAMAGAPLRLLGGQGQPETQTFPAKIKSPPPKQKPHRFFDRTNLMLFAGVAAVRTLDFTSTQHFRHNGNNEVMLTNSIVDNKPLFAGIEVAGTALSIGAAYWLHRTGHHKLERWVSIIHIGVGATGDIHNYSLGPAR